MKEGPQSRHRDDQADPVLDLTFRRVGSRTRLAEQRVRYPFHITRPFHFDKISAPDLATLYLQSASGGLYRGEHLDVRIAAAEGAAVCLTTQASTIVHDAKGVATVTETRIDAAEKSVVFHVPDPVILLPGAALRSAVHVRRAPGATAVVSEAFLAHDPDGLARPFAEFVNEMSIETPDGAPEVIDRMVITAADIPFIRSLGPTLAAAGVIIAGPDGEAADPAQVEAEIGPVEGARLAVSRLPFGTGLSIRIVAASGVALSTALDAAFAAAFRLVYGAEPARRRK